jgi:PhnB protein
MTDTVKFIPSGYRTATPYLIVNGAAAAIAFYQQSFGARVLMQIAIPKGKIGHAELEIGDSRIMIADEFPELGYRGPIALGGTPVSIVLYVEDCDAVIRRAIGNGAMALKPTLRINFTATAPGQSRIHLGTSGPSRHTRKTSRRKS